MKKILLLIVLSLPMMAWFMSLVMVTILELLLDGIVRFADVIEEKLNK